MSTEDDRLATMTLDELRAELHLEQAKERPLSAEARRNLAKLRGDLILEDKLARMIEYRESHAVSQIEFESIEARVLIDVLKAEKTEMAQNELELFACLLLGAPYNSTSGNAMQNKREGAKNHPEKYREAEERVKEKLLGMKNRSANCQFPKRIERWLEQSGNS